MGTRIVFRMVLFLYVLDELLTGMIVVVIVASSANNLVFSFTCDFERPMEFFKFIASMALK